MLRTVIIDDERRNTRILIGLLEEFCPQVELVGEATDAETGRKIIKEKQPDLVFLDIEMPFGNAFDLLDKIMPVAFEIVFITAFDEYTLKAIKYSALDYLLKPVSIDDLKLAVQKAMEKIQYKNINQQLSNLLHNLGKSSPSLQKIGLSWKDEIVFVSINDIMRVEANTGYTSVYTSDKRKYLSTKTIKEYEEMLPEHLFFRVHHSHIVNLNFVRKYHKGRGGRVEMTDNVNIEVATRRKDEFLALFGHNT